MSVQAAECWGLWKGGTWWEILKSLGISLERDEIIFWCDLGSFHERVVINGTSLATPLLAPMHSLIIVVNHNMTWLELEEGPCHIWHYDIFICTFQTPNKPLFFIGSLFQISHDCCKSWLILWPTQSWKGIHDSFAIGWLWTKHTNILTVFFKSYPINS